MEKDRPRSRKESRPLLVKSTQNTNKRNKVSEAVKIMKKLVEESNEEVEMYEGILKKAVLKAEAIKAQAKILGVIIEEKEGGQDEDASK